MQLSFVDTSAWVSMADGAESSHAQVAAALRERRRRRLTADHVLQEAWMVMKHRHGRFAAEGLVNAIRRGTARAEESLLGGLEAAATIAAAFADQDFSLADRTSWAVMERLGVTEAVSLGRDFRVYRYGPGRRRAFDVVPQAAAPPPPTPTDELADVRRIGCGADCPDARRQAVVPARRAGAGSDVAGDARWCCTLRPVV